MSASSHVCLRLMSSTLRAESGSPKAEDASARVRPGIESVSLSRGEEEMELMVQVGERMRVRVEGVMWEVRAGKSVDEVGG